jgi:thioredoxin-related protein
MRLPALFLGMLLTCAPLLAATPQDDALIEFDDRPLNFPLQHPDWFKDSFLDLRDDLDEALQAGKKGIMVYFGQKRCAYCRQLIRGNFGQSDIVAYTRTHFDLIPIDVWGIREVTDLQGNTLTEHQYAVRENTDFTPSILFFNREGREVLRLRGYYPPYQFRAALEYVVDAHYLREPFTAYLARGDNTMRFEPDELNEEDFFAPPPHHLDRSRLPGERPLVVFFEQSYCHACDILHGQTLQRREVRQPFYGFDAVQLDMHSDQPLIKPDGKASTASAWSRELGLFYAPSLIFFDEQGKEILRVDSVVNFFRLHNVLNYINSKAYLNFPTFQDWRIRNYLNQ